MSNQEHWVLIGCFGRPYGIKGFVTVHSFTEPQDNVLKYVDWHACIHNEWQPIKLMQAKVQHKSIIVQIEGYPDRDSVARLTRTEIAVRSDQLEQLDPGEYYWHQLIGMNVLNQQGHSLGKVLEIIPTGSNDVLVIEGTKKHLIPYLPGQFVLNVDLNQQLITVDWDMDF